MSRLVRSFGCGVYCWWRWVELVCAGRRLASTRNCSRRPRTWCERIIRQRHAFARSLLCPQNLIVLVPATVTLGMKVTDAFIETHLITTNPLKTLAVCFCQWCAGRSLPAGLLTVLTPQRCQQFLS